MGRHRGRAGPVVAVLVAAVVLVTLGAVVPSVGPPADEAEQVDDDTVALPDAPGTAPAVPTGQPRQVRCTRAQVPVDCLSWEVDAGERVSLGPRLPGADALVDSRPDALTVRDPDTGEVRWVREELAGSVPLTVVDGVLVLGGRDQPARGVDLADGAVLWSAADLHAVGPVARLAPEVVVLGRRAPDVPEATALVGLEPRSGEVRWEWETAWSGTVETAVQPVGTTGVLATGRGRLARVDAATGQAAWVVDTLPGAYLQPHGSGHVSAQQLGTDADPQLWIHDAATGDVVHRMPATRVATHVVLDDLVVVHAPAEGVVRGMDLGTGERRWQMLLDGAGALGFPVTPAEGDMVVVLERDAGRVTRVDPATGAPVWETALASTARTRETTTFFGQPMLVDGTVVVEDTSSVITVLDAATGAELVRVDGGPQLDVRSLAPLTLVDDTRWMRVRVPAGQ